MSTTSSQTDDERRRQARLMRLRSSTAGQFTAADTVSVSSAPSPRAERASLQPLLHEQGAPRSVGPTSSVSSVFDGGGKVGGLQGELSTRIKKQTDLAMNSQTDLDVMVVPTKVSFGVCGGVVVPRGQGSSQRMCIKPACTVGRHATNKWNLLHKGEAAWFLQLVDGAKTSVLPDPKLMASDVLPHMIPLLFGGSDTLSYWTETFNRFQQTIDERKMNINQRKMNWDEENEEDLWIDNEEGEEEVEEEEEEVEEEEEEGKVKVEEEVGETLRKAGIELEPLPDEKMSELVDDGTSMKTALIISAILAVQASHRQYLDAFDTSLDEVKASYRTKFVEARDW